MTRSVFDENKNNQGKPFTGTSTGTYALAAWLYGAPGAQFLIYNKHASNTLKYKVIIYLADPDDITTPGIAYLIKDEATLAGGATPTPGAAPAVGATGSNLVIEDCVNRPLFKAEVWVKSGTDACDYQIDAFKYP